MITVGNGNGNGNGPGDEHDSFVKMSDSHHHSSYSHSGAMEDDRCVRQAHLEHNSRCLSLRCTAADEMHLPHRGCSTRGMRGNLTSSHQCGSPPAGMDNLAKEPTYGRLSSHG